MSGRFSPAATLAVLATGMVVGLTPRQIEAGPGWLRSDRWDINAKAGAPGTIDQLHLALPHVLEERFHLKLRRETRQEPVYDLVVAGGGAKLSPHQPPHDTNTPAQNLTGRSPTW